MRLAAEVFGLSAARDLGIGQLPRRMAPYLDTVYAMTYPSLFGPGELGLADPGATPGATVQRALRRFELALRGRDVLLANGPPASGSLHRACGHDGAVGPEEELR